MTIYLTVEIMYYKVNDVALCNNYFVLVCFGWKRGKNTDVLLMYPRPLWSQNLSLVEEFWLNWALVASTMGIYVDFSLTIIKFDN